MRIATWNLQRPFDLRNERVEVIRQKLESIDADVWILTETNSQLRPSEQYHGLASNLVKETHKPNECRTAVWSRFPIISQVPTFDSKTAVCLEIESPKGPLLVYGTIIPYGGAGTKYGYWFNGQRRKGAKSWQLHYESIEVHQSDWSKLRSRFPNHHLCIAGDFNQSRDGRRWGKNKRQWYGTDKGRQLLSKAISDLDVRCVTESDFFESGQLRTKSSVDHVCLSSQLAESVVEVGAWEAGSVGGRRLSDHNGVFVNME